ncbi:MAG: phenylacetate-CoA oxygenase subunit PaaC [Actinomycetota bacterium]|nr:phenylacetate-CoA oxygenase subunit PaaC [Actinomycetota bacterium]
MTVATTTNTLVGLLVRHADDNTILCQRLGEYVSGAPELEEDLAVANVALDHVGVAMHLYEYAAELDGGEASMDNYAMLRSEREFTNALLVEQPNVDFAHVVARGFFFDVYQTLLWAQLSASTDERLAGIAARAFKEATYHLRHSRAWMLRLGDGTAESHRRVQAAVDAVWRFTGELFVAVDADSELVAEGIGADVAALKPEFDRIVDATLEEATLVRPSDPYQATGGRSGMHTEHLGHLLAEMQWMQRTYPGATW